MTTFILELSTLFFPFRNSWLPPHSPQNTIKKFSIDFYKLLNYTAPYWCLYLALNESERKRYDFSFPDASWELFFLSQKIEKTAKGGGDKKKGVLAEFQFSLTAWLLHIDFALKHSPPPFFFLSLLVKGDAFAGCHTDQRASTLLWPLCLQVYVSPSFSI